MMIILEIAAVIVLLICLGFLAYWAVAVIKGDAVFRLEKSKRSDLQVTDMGRNYVKLTYTCLLYTSPSPRD